MAEAPPLVINADPELILRALAVIDQMEAFIDGVISAHGQFGREPRVILNEDVDMVRDELHCLICPTCAAARTSAQKPINTRQRHSASVTVFPGGKPDEKDKP